MTRMTSAQCESRDSRSSSRSALSTGQFSAFYENCPVLKAESDELRESRLSLCAVVFRAMTTGLDLLGLEAPEQM